MKFGSQLKRTSVPEWKNYNLDYNDIKRRIKLVTTIKDNSQKEALVNNLHDSLVNQIDMVNLFVDSKVGEIKRRTIHLESFLDSLTEEQWSSNDNDPKTYSIESQISKLSSDLQKLSRFLMLQKTALRKLLKKYTKYSQDGGELNTEINKYVIKSPNSFIHVDLSGLYLEIALIYDLIREKNNTPNSPITSPKKSSRRSLSLNTSNDDLNRDEFFDFESMYKSTQTLKFFVHYDNLNELKLFLLQNFYLIDQSMNNQRQYLKMTKKNSTMSIREIIANQKNKLKTVPEEDKNDDQNQEQQQPHNGLSKQTIENNEIYRSNSIYLNNSDGLVIDSTITQIVFDDPNKFNSIKTNTDPTILLTKNKETFRSLLISAIGGLRKNSNILFNNKIILEDLLSSCLNDENYEEFQKNHVEFFNSLDSLEKISIEFIFKKHFKPLLKTCLTKSRFSNTLSNDHDQFKCWISLQSNMKFSKVDLDSPVWTNENDSNNDLFPYAYLRIHHNSPSLNITSFPESLQNLIKSHLIYQIDDLNFTILTYSLYKSGKLSFKPHWFELFEKKDIRKLPPKVILNKKTKSKHLELETDSPHESISGESSQQFRYWNEFDNGSDFEGNEAEFFIPLEDIEESESGSFLFFSKSTIDKFYNLSFKLNKILNEKLPSVFESLTSANDKIDPDDFDPLLTNTTPYGDYGGITSTFERPQSDIESMLSNSSGSSLSYTLKNSKLAHDKFIIFLALATSLLSFFLTAVSLGISTSLMSIGDILVNEFVIFILVFALLISLFFAVLSMCLYMMSESEHRTLFQTAFIWINFILVNFMIIGGLVSVFGI